MHICGIIARKGTFPRSERHSTIPYDHGDVGHALRNCHEKDDQWKCLSMLYIILEPPVDGSVHEDIVMSSDSSV